MTEEAGKNKADQKVKSPEDTSGNKRREALTKIVATAGITHAMSGNWAKPLLSSVVLPAHANMSYVCCDGDGDSDQNCVPCCDGEMSNDGCDGLDSA